MKMSTRNLMRAVRLYGLADDNTPMKAIRRLQVYDGESFVRAEFVLDKHKYALLYGSGVDEEELDELWPHRPDNAEPLPNPLDPTTTETPFQGKFVMLFTLPTTTQRLDTFLATEFDSSLSRSLWQKYIKDGRVSVNGQLITQPKYDVRSTDDIAVSFPEMPDDTHDLPLIFENDDIVVVNKPSGLLTHAKGGISLEQTVAEMMRPKTTFALDSTRPGIVHRLDRDTSGVMVIARNPEAAHDLQQQFAGRRVAKVYLAVVEGHPEHPKAQIDLPIARHPQKPSTFRVDPNGKPAQTLYEVLATNGRHSLIKLRPRTGRTHQLRVHMQHLGTPIVGDPVYGQAGERLMLHAWQLTITLPNGQERTFTAPIPAEVLHEFPEVTL